MAVNYEFDGDKYKEASKPQKKWGKTLISQLNLSGNEVILDLGCGDGVLTAQLANLVPQGSVLGIDASRGMIATASQLQQDNLHFQLLDITLMDFHNEFDLVFSNAALHWIKDHAQLLAKTYNSLKPGGTIRFNFAGAGNCPNFNRVLQETIAEPAYKQLFADFQWPWFFTETAVYDAQLREATFRDIKVWTENADTYFPDQDQFIQWLDQPCLVPFMQHLKEEQVKQSFRHQVIEKMLLATRQEDGSCFESFQRLNVYARK